MALQNVSGKELENKLGSGVQIVNVFGTWCGPCKILAPVLDELSDNVEVFIVDVDHNKDYVEKMQVRGVPTTFIYNNGVLKETITGFVPKETLESKIENAK